MDRTQHAVQRAQVQSLVGELRFPTSPTAWLKEDRIKSNQIKIFYPYGEKLRQLRLAQKKGSQYIIRDFFF